MSKNTMARKVLSLSECESIVKNESQNYVKIGYALSLIKSYELYKECGSNSFAKYVRERFGYSLRWATKHIEQMTVVALIFDLKSPEDFLGDACYFKDAYISANVASAMQTYRKTKQALKDLYADCLSYVKKSQTTNGKKTPCLRIKMNDLLEVLIKNEETIDEKVNAATAKNVIALLDKVEKSLDKMNTCGIIELTRMCIRAIRDNVAINSSTELSDKMKADILDNIKFLVME